MRRAILIGAVSMCACGAEGGDDTAIDLAIAYDPELGLDRFALTGSAGGESVVERTLLPDSDRPISASGRETVLLLVPEALGGTEVTVRVEGLSRGDVVAAGQVTVLVSRGELVAAEVTLRPGDGEGCDAWGWEPSNIAPCEDAAPEAPLVLDRAGVYRVDTETGLIATPDGESLAPATALVARAGGPMLRLIAIDQLVVESGTVLEAVGPYPLVLVVWGDASIAGAIDVSAGGARAADCGVAGDGNDAGNDASGAGGGGGGAYGGDGGDGGDGHGDHKGDKGIKGRISGEPALVPLRGGCPGGRGGDGFGAGGSGGSGGAPGGGIQIAARGALTVSGALRAAGGSGQGGSPADTSGAGGGGGGSGGAILLEAGAIHIGGDAALCANGGSGGEGGSEQGGGADGASGTCSEERAASAGQVSEGGDGGRGSAGDDSAGENGKAGSASGAGGGGGGGIGRVRLRAIDDMVDLGALITPQAE